MDKKYGGGSYGLFKQDVANYIKKRLKPGAKILDLGCGGGTYGHYLANSGYHITGVDIWMDAIDICKEFGNYDELICQDIRKFDYKDKEYDLIIMGDVLEHLSIKDAKNVILTAQEYAKHLLVAVPYLYEQDEMYGNKAEKHLQPDLTPEKFDKRYPGFTRIFGNELYGYYWKSPKAPDIKICVYAICKNESKFVKQWLDSMSEADYIVVLDTGSTDDTVDLLKADPRVTRVETAMIDPWRFDVARNESLKLVPDDADVLVCTDLDEKFEPGWADLIRDTWLVGATNMAFYTYAWSHNDAGEPQDVFIYNKIHDRNYRWRFPVHEVLEPIDADFKPWTVDFGDSIYLHHYPDREKSRSSYLPLLELSLKENPEDSHVAMLLAREHYITGDVDKAIDAFLETLKMPDIDRPDKREVLLNSLLQLALMYREIGNYDEALWYSQEFIKEDWTFKEPYLVMASVYNIMKMYTLAEYCCKAAEEYGYQHYSWVERNRTYTSWPADEISIAQFALGKTKEAVKNGQEALKHEPNDVRLLKNVNAYLSKRLAEIEPKEKIELEER